MKILSDFIHGFDFVRMKPDNSVIKGGVPAGGTARALVERGRAMAIYLRGNWRRSDRPGGLCRSISPHGAWQGEWVDTKRGNGRSTGSGGRRRHSHRGGAHLHVGYRVARLRRQ